MQHPRLRSERSLSPPPEGNSAEIEWLRLGRLNREHFASEFFQASRARYRQEIASRTWGDDESCLKGLINVMPLNHLSTGSSMELDPTTLCWAWHNHFAANAEEAFRRSPEHYARSEGRRKQDEDDQWS